MEPETIVIRDNGEYTLSETEFGNSTIEFYKAFLDKSAADTLQTSIVGTVPFVHRSDVEPDGTKKPHHRLNHFYGPNPFSYYGLTHEPDPMPDFITKIRDKILNETSHSMNSVLINLYRDGKDKIDWHSDVGDDPTVCSLTLGDERLFHIRRIPGRRKKSESHVQYLIPLPHGSLIVMKGAMQRDWQHSVPPVPASTESRINLTFRDL